MNLKLEEMKYLAYRVSPPRVDPDGWKRRDLGIGRTRVRDELAEMVQVDPEMAKLAYKMGRDLSLPFKKLGPVGYRELLVKLGIALSEYKEDR